MLFHYLGNYYRKIELSATKLSLQRFWELKTALLSASIVILFSFPNYDFLTEPNCISLNEAVQKKIDHPFLQREYDIKSHQAKLAFRITVPLFAHIFHLNVLGCFILENVLGVLFFYLIILIFKEMADDKVTGIFASLFFACIYVGKPFFSDVASGFDGYSFLFILLAMYFKNPLLIFTFILLANFTDERAIVASGLIYLWHVYKTNGARFDLQHWSFKNKTALVVLLSLATTFAIRYLLFKIYGLYVPIGSDSDAGIEVIRTNWPFLPLGIFCSIEFGWVIIGLSIILLLHNRNYIFAFCMVFTIALGQLIASMVLDFSRSSAFSYPAILLGFLILSRSETKEIIRLLTFLSLVGSFLFASIYVEGISGCTWFSPILPKILKWL